MDGPFSQDALVGVSSKIHNLIPGGREHGDDFSTSDRAAAAAEKRPHLEKCSRSEYLSFSAVSRVFFVLGVKVDFTL